MSYESDAALIGSFGRQTHYMLTIVLVDGRTRVVQGWGEASHGLMTRYQLDNAIRFYQALKVRINCVVRVRLK